MKIALLASVFVSFFLFLSVIYQIVSRRFFSADRAFAKRIEEMSAKTQKEVTDVPFIVRDDQLSNIPILHRILQKLHVAKKLDKLIQQANKKIKVGELVLLMLVLGSLGAFIARNHYGMLTTIVIFCALAGLPVFYLLRLKNKRMKEFDKEFPTAINVLASALKSGHSFNRAIQLVAGESSGPVGLEFKRVSEEYSLGLPLQEAMTNLSQRIDSVALKIFITAVLLQKETGGNLTEILDKIAVTIRERFKLAGQIKIYSAQARLSAWIIGMMPIAFVALVSLMNPGYIKPLFDTHSGNIVLGIAVGLQLTGAMIIKKIVHIKRF